MQNFLPSLLQKTKVKLEKGELRIRQNEEKRKLIKMNQTSLIQRNLFQ